MCYRHGSLQDPPTVIQYASSPDRHLCLLAAFAAACPRAGRRGCDRPPQPPREPVPADLGPDRAIAVREPAAQGTAPQVPGGRGVPLPGEAAAAPAGAGHLRAGSRPPGSGPAAEARRRLRPVERARRARALRSRSARPRHRRRSATRSCRAARSSGGAGRGYRRPDRRGRGASSARPLDLQPGRPRSGIRRAAPQGAPRSARARASPPPASGDPRAEYELAYSYLRSGNTSRPKWASAGSSSPIRATGWCRTPPTGSARAISSAAATARPPSSS